MLAGTMDGTTLQNISLSGNQVTIQENHKGTTGIGTATSVAGVQTNVTVVNPPQPATPNQNSSGTSTNSNEEPVASPIPDKLAEPEPTPTEEPLPSSEPLEKGDTFEQDGSVYEVLSGGKVGYAGGTDDEPVESKEVIPDTVTENGVIYPVTRILENAFNGETKLKEITFGKYIEVVEQSAFKNCSSLKEVESSPVLRVIDDDAFINCKKIKQVNLPITIEKIGDRAFKNCKKMKEFILGDESLAVPEAEIAGVNDEIKLSYSMKRDTINISIGASVFENCQNLQRVVINCQVTTIGNAAFARCSSLSSIVVYSKKLRVVGDKALVGVHDCCISVYKIRLKKYTTLFKNKGQGKKVVVAKI